MADPLGPDNVLVFAAGMYAGTSVPNGGRLSVGGKSPLTGGIKEANSGGSAARALAGLGLRGIKVAGVAAELCVLEVSAERRELVPAPELAGLGPSTPSIACGRVRRQGVVHLHRPGRRDGRKAAAVLVTTADHYLRAAARGGLGAVMGSKNLKAIVIDGAGGPGVESRRQGRPQGGLQGTHQGHPRTLPWPPSRRWAPRSWSTSPSRWAVSPPRTSPPGPGTRPGHHRRAHGRADVRASERPTKHSCMKGCIVNCSQVYTDEAGEVITSGSSSRPSDWWAPTARSTTSTRSRGSTTSVTTSVSTPWTSAPPWAWPWRAACSRGATAGPRTR